MKNTVVEEKQRNIIEKGQKINVSARSFNMNMKEFMDDKKTINIWKNKIKKFLYDK